MYGGGTGGAGYGVGLGPGPGPSHYAPSGSGVSYQLGPPPPPPPAACPTGGSQLLSYGPNLSPHHIQQTHVDSQQSSKTRRSDEDDTSGCKYRRLEDDNVQDKERFASRENHCEIERRRRNKMTAYITELSDMVPTCSALARKPDKLTILRMAVAHMKALRGTGNTATDNAYKPSFLTDQELKHLILEAADGFLFVVSCDSGRIIYVSDSVAPVLNYTQSDWYGTSLYSQVHPDDTEKVREQLSAAEPQQGGRVLDLKTGTVKREGQSSMRLCMGSRRGFICRMKVGNLQTSGDMAAAHGLHRIKQRNSLGPPARDGQNYAVVHCTGYIKNWPPTGDFVPPCVPGVGLADRGPGAVQTGPDGVVTDESASTHCCLVAIGRLQVTSTPNTNDLAGSNSNSEFISRHSAEGTFTFVDQRVGGILGYTPSELLGHKCYQFFHPEDETHMRESFEQVLKLKGQVVSVMYRFRAKNRDWVWLRTSAFAFLNPFNDDVEYIVCTNSHAKSFHSGSDGQTESEAVPAYGQPGLDYSLQRHPTRDPIYPAHHMMQHPAAVAAAGPQQPRPSSTQNVYQGYETTQSPIAYGSPGQQSTTSSVLSRIQKPANTSPTPVQQAWAIGRQQPVTEGYQYSQLSPSRSPSGPTYTQLSSGARTPATQYHAVTTVPNNPGMWGWQGQQHQTPQQDAAQSNPQVAGQTQPPHPTQAGGPGTQPQELSDMLQMLQDQGGASGFEELNMFNTNFE
ncbi:aryl hydrocarbon receptor nuclear translocator homolog isoform X1 [Vespula pensylvanica]|uniref:aryl hydrocarbon receptor nuclear translocator homolog isoform X1 n=1 Tax=Vespula pensylvanica TaxID=30213 RepID=UPI001CBA5BD7|nr:aryl hydrocarbon receptor nuclear translocator homolog isoform X1 [Vespula pensylvanica]XP_050855189.1 aryl hydrocarbon receptor nuclear translocator homolog isoform X1 [Vespula vulgaris]